MCSMINIDVEKIFDEYFNNEKNFLTPQPLEYGYEKYGEYLLLYEESQGEGFFNNDLFGLTFLRYDIRTSEVQRIDLDKSFTSEKEAYDYFKEINESMFEEADIYGEIKMISVVGS